MFLKSHPASSPDCPAARLSEQQLVLRICHSPTSERPADLRGGGGVCAVETNTDSRDDEGLVACQEQHTLILK